MPYQQRRLRVLKGCQRSDDGGGGPAGVRLGTGAPFLPALTSITAATASSADRFPSSTCATAVSTGRLTRYLRASVTTAPAVAMPSATCELLATIDSRLSPRPSRSPTERLRDRLP
eukprot:362401-Chlamydomonas_euryale.AAC.3